MIETNIRIVNPGAELYLDTRYALLEAQDSSPKLAQQACNALRRRHRLAAVPCPDMPVILVVTQDPIQSVILQGDDWSIEVRDGEETRHLCFANPEEASVIAELVWRCMLIHIERTDLWRIRSLHIWYQPEPFKVVKDIAAYRGYKISTIPIQSVGVGISVDIVTAFFTTQTVADFFRDDIPEQEQRRQQERFKFLSRRQHGRKGTLLYDLDQSKHDCYFEEYLQNVTCATTGKRRISGCDYESLLDYYQKEYPHLRVDADEPVASVSFRGLDYPQPVPARRLRLRAMNESLPKKLNQVSKIPPDDRCALISKFWNSLGNYPLGRGKPGVSSRFWRPGNGQVKRIKPPDLAFADRQVVLAPTNGSLKQRREYYRQRLALLNKYGCIEVPPRVPRTIHIAVPEKTRNEVSARLAADITERLSNWAKKQINHRLVTYSSLNDAFARLLLETSSGVVVFVFEDEDPATYFTVSFELKRWRVKRITYNNLNSAFTELQSSGNIRSWRSFIEMNALDILQQMDCVPWKVANQLNYEAQLAIDVGWDRQYFALSLLICRSQSGNPKFWLGTAVQHKSDKGQGRETINETILSDEIVRLFERARGLNFDPLRSVLVLRDGRECGQELDGIASAKEELVRSRILEKEAKMDVIDVHKRSLKGIRLWDKSPEGVVEQIPEGSVVFLDKHTVIMANTGAPTLHQGTAEPIMLIGHDGVDMADVATDVSAATQFNWSNPRVAQRLPIEFKQTDDELKKKAAQEIRRVQ
jgi:hypothetical protein